MSLADLSQSIPFLIFLVLFVLLGIYPVWQRIATIVRKILADSNNPEAIDSDISAGEPAGSFAEQQPTHQLDTLESIVFQQLVMNDGKSLSRKQLNAGLHLEPARLKTALDSLLHRGLLKVTMTALPIVRFRLTERGRNYARETGAVLPLR